jgi:hypothetical protein
MIAGNNFTSTGYRDSSIDVLKSIRNIKVAYCREITVIKYTELVKDCAAWSYLADNRREKK